MNDMPDFATFFSALWGYQPFPWQTMLAERVREGRWPQALDLPTATGKTACIDVAIYALARQASRPIAERTAPRRIWFIVDRRIVVDEAYDRAQEIARKLAKPEAGPLKDIADQLLTLGNTDRPVRVARLRGGVLQDDSWSTVPSQPAVICSTVDQLGSRLLFRGYGRSQLAAPIFAGLAAHDSLILLDEAHCSVPFLETVRSIETYRGEAWAESPIRTPFAFSILSATPPPGIPRDAIFPGAERNKALDSQVLRARLQAEKPATLDLIKPVRGSDRDPLVSRCASLAHRYVHVQGKRRVAVIVNRVRTAQEIFRALTEAVNDEGDVVLLTGRMRPFDRERVVSKWKEFLRANNPKTPAKAILVVSTQCLEVGADFSFDALVTECASLDALRQRFGRLNRMGLPGPAPATIVMREQDVDDEEDPVYGAGRSRTWRLLIETAVEGNGTLAKAVDFGVEALDSLLEKADDVSAYLGPSAHAPVLLPAHLDLLCQTSPTPRPDPDVSVYLHGQQPGAPEARVVWRADLPQEETDVWNEVVALCPPVSGEMLSVPLYRLREWLTTRDAPDNTADVEGVGVPSAGSDVKPHPRPFLLWRGRERSKVEFEANRIRPNDVVVVPAAYGLEGLGQPIADGLGEPALDIWELARKMAGRPLAVRLNGAVLAPWRLSQPIDALVRLARSDSWDRETLRAAIEEAVNSVPQDLDASAGPPFEWLEMLREVRLDRVKRHPADGLILFGPRRSSQDIGSEVDLFGDDDDVLSEREEPATLSDHTNRVRQVVAALADRCLPEALHDAMRLAAMWHDAGKLDGRFQVLLRDGDEIAALSDAALAKSACLPVSPARRHAIRTASGLPPDFRHEMLSLQLAERQVEHRDGATLALALHLIASHHGHARPFAPVVIDHETPSVSGEFHGLSVTLEGEQRAQLVPAHRLDSGISERFWQLNRRYGWWGLAYLEALLRLGDWYASERPGQKVHRSDPEPQS